MSSDNPPKQKLGEGMTSPWSAFLGSGISSGFAIALYLLTTSIVSTFADKPMTSDNPTTINITIAVRTLVMGMAAMATAVFALIAVGLLILTLQLIWERFQSS
jgi:hypothetical protein